MKSMKKFETHTDRCYLAEDQGFFQNVPSVPRSKNEVWNRKNVSLEKIEISWVLLNIIRQKITRSTDTNEDNEIEY